MRIRWENLVPVFLLVLIVVLIIKSKLFELISKNVENLRHHQNDPVYGLASLAIICLGIVGVFKIITRNKR